MDAAPLTTAPGTVRGVRGNRVWWLRPLIAALLALALLLLALLAVDRAGGYVTTSDVYAAVAAALLAGVVAA